MKSVENKLTLENEEEDKTSESRKKSNRRIEVVSKTFKIFKYFCECKVQDDEHMNSSYFKVFIYLIYTYKLIQLLLFKFKFF